MADSCIFRCIVCTVCLGISVSALAQSFHFSQYNVNHALINPGLTGAKSHHQGSTVFRSQWQSVGSGITTLGASYETRLGPVEATIADSSKHLSKFRNIENMAAGISCFQLRSNEGYSQLNVLFALASRYYLTRESFLSIGMQGAFGQVNQGGASLIYPNQFMGNGYDPNLPNGETVQMDSKTYGFFNAGLSWVYSRDMQGLRTYDQLYASAGLSVYYINRPQIGRDPKAKIHNHFVFHGEVEFGINQTPYSLNTMYLVQVNGPSKEFVFGAIAKYALRDQSKYTGLIQSSKIGIGLHHRINDAVIVQSIFEWQRWCAGISYDITISTLNQASLYRGGMELTLAYRHK